jgi:hypothetical protein
VLLEDKIVMAELGAGECRGEGAQDHKAVNRQQGSVVGTPGGSFDSRGQSVTRTGAVTSPVYDPSTGEVQARLEHVNHYGEDSILFFMRTKNVTERWPHGGPATD